MSYIPLIKRRKPCPFCGGAAVVSESSGWFGVGCETIIDGVMCNGRSSALQHKSEVEAIDKWNLRTPANKTPAAWKYQRRDGFNQHYYWTTSLTDPKHDPYFNPESGRPIPLYE